MRLFSPAKINLYLAVTGRRADGFHELVSLVAPLSFGDVMHMEEADEDGIACEHPLVPRDGSNLILRAAELFRQRTGLRRHFHFELEKRIPPGGGFGGGSGNGVRALEAMNEACGEPIGKEGLFAVAAELGSDCPLFLEKGPVVIRGRGERVEPKPTFAGILTSWKVALFNPGFSCSTAEVFRRWSQGAMVSPALRTGGTAGLARGPEDGLGELLADLEGGAGNLRLRNDLGAVLAEKFLFYRCLSSILAGAGLANFAITGSGSGCFVLYRSEDEGAVLKGIAKQWLKGDGFLVETGFFGSQHSGDSDSSQPLL